MREVNGDGGRGPETGTVRKQRREGTRTRKEGSDRRRGGRETSERGGRGLGRAISARQAKAKLMNETF